MNLFPLRLATQTYATLKKWTDCSRRTRPEWILLTAAYTDVDGSEREPEAAYAVNAKGTENVARSARKYGAKLMYVSTDYVFDGQGTRPYEASDAIAPIGVYGASKAAGETASRNTCRIGASCALRGYLARPARVSRKKFCERRKRGQNYRWCPIRLVRRRSPATSRVPCKRWSAQMREASSA